MGKAKQFNRNALDEIFSSTAPGPIAVVNLLKFYDEAKYREDAPEYSQNLTGREAYTKYVNGYNALLKEYDSRIQFWGVTETYFSGDSNWDATWINVYPNRETFRRATSDERFKAIFYHRQAGVAFQEAYVSSVDIGC
jgi:hypothetical protein